MGLAFLITSENLQILSERKVLKENEYAALLEANTIIATAQKERERILQEAQRQYEQKELLGYRDGVARGQLEYARKAFASALDSASQLRALRQTMADMVVRAVTELADELEPRHLFAAALRRIEALVRDEAFVVLRVAPSQEGALREALAKVWQRDLNAQPVKVVADPSLADTACVAQTPSGEIDASLEIQITALRQAILQREAP